MGIEFHRGMMKKFWKWIHGEGYTTMCMHLIQLKCPLKMVKRGNFMLCIFYQNRIIIQKKAKQIWSMMIQVL